MKFIIISTLLLTSMFCLAQDIKLSSTNTDIDTNYIEDFSDRLVIRTFFKKKSNAVKITDTKAEGNTITYKPNQGGSFGGGFNYKWLGIDFAFKAPVADSVNDALGKSSSFDFQANMYMRKFAIDFFLLNYTGYYIENSANFGSSNAKIKYPHLSSGIIGANINYLFNHKKFSYRAAYLQNERQKKSAGSLFGGAFFSKGHVRSDSSIIPKQFVSQFRESSNIINANYVVVGAQFGYAHSFIFKKFYLTLSLGLGAGVQFVRIEAADEEFSASNSAPTGKVLTRFALGYNGDRFSMGIQNTHDSFVLSSDQENSKLEYQIGSFKFFLAYRLKAPKFLEKASQIKLF